MDAMPVGGADAALFHHRLDLYFRSAGMTDGGSQHLGRMLLADESDPSAFGERLLARETQCSTHPRDELRNLLWFAGLDWTDDEADDLLLGDPKLRMRLRVKLAELIHFASLDGPEGAENYAPGVDPEFKERLGSKLRESVLQEGASTRAEGGQACESPSPRPLR